MAGVGLAFGILSGVLNAKAAGDEAAATRSAFGTQARISQTNANNQANRILEDIPELTGRQVNINAASGFELGGSPYMAMMKSIDEAKRDAEDIREAGAVQAEYLNASGRAAYDAGITKSKFAIFSAGVGAYAGHQQYLDRTARKDD